MSKITVIDNIMGDGKTTGAIQYINNAPDNENFLYITPFLNEISRIIDCADRDFRQPVNKGDGNWMI